MGKLFRNPLIIHYRKVGVVARDFVVSLQLSENEKSIIELLAVERHVFVAERHYLMTGLILSIFQQIMEHDEREEVALAFKMTKLNLEDHFSTRPGVPPDLGLRMMQYGINVYPLLEPERLGKRFLTALNEDRFQGVSANDIPGLVDLISSYITNSITFLSDQIEDLR